MTSLSSFLRRLAPAALAAATILCLPLPARAEDEGGEGGPEELQKKIQEQMQKIVRLMRDNEQKLLDAARGGRERPDPVDVKPPETPETPAMAGGDPSMAEPSMGEPSMGEPSMGEPSMGDPSMAEGAGDPKKRGEEIRKSIEELLEGVRRDGQRIPKELEELIRMIPMTSGQGPSSQEPKDSQGQPEPEKRNASERKTGDDGSPESPDKPKDPAKRNEDRGGQKPPDGEKGDEAATEVPPWIVTLPPEFREVKTAADLEKFPEEYRATLERYLKWQAEHAGSGNRPK